MAKSNNNAEPEVIDSEAETVEGDTETGGSESFLPQVSNFHMVLITGFGLALLVIIVMLASGTRPEQAMAEAIPATESAPTASAPAASAAAATPAGDIVGEGVIERKGEGRHFYTTIRIPPGAETLYLSGSGARQMEDGTWGDMEQQTIDTFNRFKATLEGEGWSMSDIVQVRAFAVAGEYGLLDFDGFNRGYRQFFGTQDNPMKPVRSFVEIAGLVVPGWLVEIEIRAARMPD
ncbi:MAG: Rid family hydrolase [Pseudomonadales bacterium]|jgi:enamine deaminase RidA (YjgF/YER057c/UK114 family)|nr:Rid family hydrolase [Pseudomonadales bacterium]